MNKTDRDSRTYSNPNINSIITDATLHPSDELGDGFTIGSLIVKGNEQATAVTINSNINITQN